MSERIDDYRYRNGDPRRMPRDRNETAEQLRQALIDRENNEQRHAREKLLDEFLEYSQSARSARPSSFRQPLSYDQDDGGYPADNADYPDDDILAAPVDTPRPPSFWGASAAVNTPVDPGYFDHLPKKAKIRLPSRRQLAVVALAAAWTGIGTHTIYTHEIDDPYSAIASLPIIGKDDPVKKELLDSLLANCTDGSVGDALHQGDVSAKSNLIWNVPNPDGTISPLLPTVMDPGSDVKRYPTSTAKAVLTIGVCDTDGRPAVSIRGDTVTVDLNQVESRATLEHSEAHVQGFEKERLDESVAGGIFTQETADALFAEMSNQQNADAAAANTLHDAGNILLAKDGTYDQQIESISEPKLLAHVTAILGVKAPGVPYKVEAVNTFGDTILLGAPDVQTDKLTITDTEVVSANIAPADPNAVTS